MLPAILANKIRKLQETERRWLEKDNIDFQCNFFVGGANSRGSPRLVSDLQPGQLYLRQLRKPPSCKLAKLSMESPILDRTLSVDSSLNAVAKCALLSIDSTMRSNLSVGPPVNMTMYYADTLQVRHRAQFQAGDPYLLKMRKHWEVALREASAKMPDISWNQEEAPLTLGIADLDVS